MIRAFTYSGPIEIFLVPASAPRLVVTKAMVCVILSGMMHIKEHLLLIPVDHVAAGFLTRCLIRPLPYV